MEREENLEFDKVIERKNTDCLKYDFAVKRGKPEHVLPLWVADMDFQTSSRVIEAIIERTRHGVFGYTESGESYYEAVGSWMEKQHGWKTKQQWLVKTPGVVFALAMTVKAYTNPGDAVLIQQPVYYPFTEVIEKNNRVVVSNTLVLKEDGKYHIDFADFEQKIIKNQIKLFLLCSPHNPVSRVWSKEELIKIGEICFKHNTIVVSDEIHEDFVFGKKKHYVFADVKKEFEDIAITCTSPAKTFNLAGLQVSNIFIPNEKLRAKFLKEKEAAGYSQLNTLGLIACEVAYRYGEEWYQEMFHYIEQNIQYLSEYLREEIPEITMIEPEGTYLIWLDFRRLQLTEQEREHLIVKKAGLWLDSGAIFGVEGEGFERINVACPRSILVTALEKLKNAIKTNQWR